MDILIAIRFIQNNPESDDPSAWLIAYFGGLSINWLIVRPNLSWLIANWLINCIDYIIHAKFDIASPRGRLLPKRSSSSWNLANYDILIVGVIVGVADKGACIEGESISKSWYSVKTYKVDAGVEEAPAKSSDIAPR